jgi:hypothetical protein
MSNGVSLFLVHRSQACAGCVYKKDAAPLGAPAGFPLIKSGSAKPISRFCVAGLTPATRAPGPRFLGRGLGGRYPRCPVPAQRAPRSAVVMPHGRAGLKAHRAGASQSAQARRRLPVARRPRIRFAPACPGVVGPFYFGPKITMPYYSPSPSSAFARRVTADEPRSFRAHYCFPPQLRQRRHKSAGRAL